MVWSFRSQTRGDLPLCGCWIMYTLIPNSTISALSALSNYGFVVQPASVPPISALGPDALLESMTEGEFFNSLSKKKTAIKAVLLDQVRILCKVNANLQSRV